MRKRKLFIVMWMIMVLFSNQMTFAAGVKKVPITQEVRLNCVDRILSKDVTVKKYRIYKGKRQYRRLNVTKKRWIDAKWRACRKK